MTPGVDAGAGARPSPPGLRVISRWPVHAPRPADVLAATVVSEEHRISFWDAMIVRSAAALGCARLWTEDLRHGQRIAGVVIADPFVAT